MRQMMTFVLLGTMGLGGSVSALELKQAESLALQSDPAIETHRATARAFEEEAVAQSSLPDPKLRLGAANLPVDTFRLDQEAMTQIRLGVQQYFPAGDTLVHRRQRANWLSKASRALTADARRRILRDVRETYLNLFYEVSAHQIVLESKALFSDLVRITESIYAAGRASQQDVVLANLERARLDDRITKIQAREEGYRASLAQWIGDAAWGAIPLRFPGMAAFSDAIDLNAVLASHPLVQAEEAKIQAGRQGEAVSRQAYRPGITATLDYGLRSGDNADGSARADFVTAMVSLDIPLFAENRQDRKVAAAIQKTAAARYRRDDRLRQLKQYYETNHARWQRLGERQALYRKDLLASARNNRETALTAYQSGVSEFNTLMRAEITELDVRLEALRIRVDRAIAQARLLYITGEQHDEIE